MRNRERVWRDVNEVLRRVKGWKKEGRNRDGKVVESEDRSNEGSGDEEGYVWMWFSDMELMRLCRLRNN